VHKAVDAELAASLRGIISLCNRAVHGEDIREADARQVIEIGTELLEVLDLEVRGFAVEHPIETPIITPEELERLLAARFRLTTVIPYVKNPERRVYMMT